MTDGLEGKPVWRRGTRCESGACVEVATVGEAVLVRSSANPVRVSIALSRGQWQEFTGRVKVGALDRLQPS